MTEPPRVRRSHRAPESIVIVSNRLPFRQGAGVGIERSDGGLVSSMGPVVRERGGRWVGWNGASARGVRRRVSHLSHDGIEAWIVPLSEREVRDAYHGMCNETIWPLYHDAIRTPRYRPEWWERYKDVNLRFARAAAQAVRPSGIVWVHDYHLQLVPRLLRKLRPRLRIGFFLHIPFPPEELFAQLPWRSEVLEGLLAADVVGFQTAASARNFSRAARRFTDAEGTDTELVFRTRTVACASFPISVDFEAFDALAADPGVVARSREIRRRVGSGRKIILSVDRLDYTKGIPERLEAFSALLESGRVSVDDCVLIQVAVPTREHAREYAVLREQVERTVGATNGRFSQPGRVAVHYFWRSLAREELLAYYRAADVMLVTPLRDGMNLVCKEYIASRTDGSGVLVLSEFAGAAEQLRRALLINPRDVRGYADCILHALRMPRAEARQRMSILRMMVRRHDVHEWAGSFLGALA